MFGLEIPTEVEGVPSEILDPINTVSWPWPFLCYKLLYLSCLFQLIETFCGVFFVLFSGQTRRLTRRHC